MRSVVLGLIGVLLHTLVSAQCLTPESSATTWDLDTAELYWEVPMTDTPHPTGARLHLGTTSRVYTVVKDYPATQSSDQLANVVPGPGHYYFAISPLMGTVAGALGPECAFVAERISADLTPPVISVTSPLPGTIVARNTPVEIRLDVSDDSGVATVVIAFVNGQEIPGCRFASPPYRCMWEVPPPPNRTYRLQGGARDEVGHVTLSAVVSVRSSKGRE